MSKGIDLELLREVFKDDTVHLSLARVDRVTFSDDNTAVYVDCTLMPDGRQIQATDSWESVGADTGSGDIPDVDDLVLVCVADREVEHAFILKRLASGEEKLPEQMRGGHFVTKAKPGKKLYLGSDTRVEIGKARNASPASEPLVLGAVLTSYLTALEGAVENVIQQLTTLPATISTAPGVLGALNPALVTALTAIKVQMAADKATYLTTNSSNIVSQIAFTERGT